MNLKSFSHFELVPLTFCQFFFWIVLIFCIKRSILSSLLITLFFQICIVLFSFFLTTIHSSFAVYIFWYSQMFIWLYQKILNIAFYYVRVSRLYCFSFLVFCHVSYSSEELFRLVNFLLVVHFWILHWTTSALHWLNSRLLIIIDEITRIFIRNINTLNES